MGGQHFSGYHSEDHGASNPVFSFFSTVQSWNPTILRVLIGGVFLYHGGQKAFGWFDGIGWEGAIKASTQVGVPVYLAVASIFAEISGAAGLLLGLFTRFWSILIVGALILSTLHLHPENVSGIEMNILLGGIAVALLFSGGGNLSVDKAISTQLLP